MGERRTLRYTQGVEIETKLNTLSYFVHASVHVCVLLVTPFVPPRSSGNLYSFDKYQYKVVCCDSSSISDNVRRSVFQSVHNDFQSSICISYNL
jgi:hypothetical protein